MHGFCTVFARSVFSMSDYVGRCIALQSVPFFASGEQCQAELCLHFRVGILEQLQKSRHGDGGFACGGYSLRAGGVGLGIEAAFKLLAQLHTGGLLDMGVGVHQHIRTGVSCSPLHCFDVAAGDHQLIGGTGMPQTVKDDAGELRVCVLPFQELLADEHRLYRQTVGEPQQHPAVAVPLRVEVFFPFQPEPRCNTLDFASKVVCQRAFRRSLDSPQDTEYRSERYFRERRAKTESLREIRRCAILLQEL